MVRYGFCIAALLATPFVAAQLPGPSGGGKPGWKSNTTPKDEVSLVASLGGFPSDGNLISGTNVNFTVGVTLGTYVEQTPHHGWTHGRVKKIVIRVGPGEGEIVKEWNNEGDLVALGTSDRIGNLEKPFAVRFASTHFPHDTVVNFRVHAEATIRDNAGVTSNLVVEVEGNQKTYNKGLVLATEESYINNQYFLDPSGDAAQIAREIIGEAIPKLQGMNHEVEPASAAAAAAQRAVDLAPKFKTNTVFYTVTHGMNYGIRASRVDEMTWPWIQTQVTEQRGAVPLYNLVVLFACETLGNGSHGVTARSFGINDGVNFEPMSVDRVMVASTVPISAGGNRTNLPEWSRLFLGYLKSGYQVGTAIHQIWVDRIYLYTTSGNTFIPVTVGDRATKLYGVYGKDKDSIWYLVS